jgi:hypothetical protein
VLGATSCGAAGAPPTATREASAFVRANSVAASGRGFPDGGIVLAFNMSTIDEMMSGAADATSKC